MKYVILIITFIFYSLIVFSQKQSFDVISFMIPKNWQQQQNEGGVQLSVSDKKTGRYAIAIITKATASDASANENFNNDWTRLVKSTVQVNDEPTMQEPSTENGWEIVSGNANYTDGSNKGLTTLLTATGGGQTVSVVLMTNTQQYQNELLSFINSLELAKATSNSSYTNSKNASGSSIVGLWTDYILETTGYNINGMPQYTAGYLRKEYSFYPDGTYLFRNKQWLTKTKNILFIYESGTYEVHGNQLTIIPKNGKSGFWGKTASSKEWGGLVKSSDYKLEKTTYTFEIIKDPTYGNSIVLKSTGPTQRDGGQFNAANDPYEFHYRFRESESSIDNPPGLKTGFENKSLSIDPLVKPINNAQANTNKTAINTPIAGSWSYSISESGLGNGYSTRQYTFKDDGTYLYRYKVFSSTMNVLLFQYESGNYTLDGNQLVISPLNGANEEWSQNKNHPDQWDKLLKTSKRKLEKVTYAFSLHYFSGIKETDLILQASKPTEREGSFGSMQDYPNGWAFKPCNPNNNPLINNPPGVEK